MIESRPDGRDVAPGRASAPGGTGNGCRGRVRPDARTPETEAVAGRRRDPRLGLVSRAVAQRRLHRDEAQPRAAAAAGVGVPQGTGYASPAIAGDRLVFLHRLANEEIVECLHPETGAEPLAVSLSARRSRIATATTTARDRARSSTGTACTRWAPKGSCTVWILRSGKVVWKRDLRAEYKVPQDFFGTASTPLVEGRLLIVNVGAPGGPCVVGLGQGDGTRGMARGQGVGAELRLAGAGGDARQAPRVRVRRRRVRIRRPAG